MDECLAEHTQTPQSDNLDCAMFAAKWNRLGNKMETRKTDYLDRNKLLNILPLVFAWFSYTKTKWNSFNCPFDREQITIQLNLCHWFELKL